MFSLHDLLLCAWRANETPSYVLPPNAPSPRYFLVEAILALSLSFVVNLAILSTFAEFFFDETCAENNHACMPDSAFSGDDSSEGAVSCGSAPGFSCGEIGLDTAGPALQEKLGQFGLTMWALGLLAAGQASTMTATLAGQITMSGFLDLQVPVVLRVALTRFIALGPAIFVCWYTADDTGLRDKVFVRETARERASERA